MPGRHREGKHTEQSQQVARQDRRTRQPAVRKTETAVERLIRIAQANLKRKS